jgi:glycerate dehydrogenase
LKIVFLDRATLPVPLRAPAFAHDWVDHDTTGPGQVAQRLVGAAIAVTNKVRIDAAVLDACPGVRLVAIAATGTDCVDLAACRARGVAVCNVRGYAGGAVAEHVFMLMLALRRALPVYQMAVRAGQWPTAPGFCLHAAPIGDLEGATLGLVGHGTLAKTVAARAAAFGMHVLVAERRGATDVRPGRTPFAQVLAEADVLSLHCPLTPETKGLVGTIELAQMKSDAIVINTARGALIDHPALLAALRGRRLGGAGIDVLEIEPPPADHPLLAADLPNLIVTPHVAWASRASMGRLGEQLVGNLEAWAVGTPRNLV